MADTRDTSLGQHVTGQPTPADGQASPRAEGIRAARPGPAPRAPAVAASRSPWQPIMLARWAAGLLLVLCAGWALIAFVACVAYKLEINVSLETAAAGGAAISLVLFLLLERNLWLSRFMGLRLEPNAHPVKEAAFLWLLGVPGLLWRSAQAAMPDPTKTKTVTQVQSGYREVIETVVFVVVLVLLLKSFAAEAFVIPTGSMAETLYGYQNIVVCPKCGYKFPVNYSGVVDPQDGHPHLIEFCTCPNCREVVSQVGRPPLPPQEALAKEVSDARSGDRVLVAKFLYDVLKRQPDRFDVVVFKYPEGPQKNWTPMNYIKRLIGEPGETIGIWYGKLYVLPPDLLPEDKALEYEQQRQDSKPQDWWQRRFMHENDLVDRLKKADGGFRILQKPPAKILSMMRIVYDHDHPAEDLKAVLPPRWAAEGAWGIDGPHSFRADAGDGLAWLRYQHVLRPPPGLPDRDNKPELITDFMAYNSYEPRRDGLLVQPPNWVGDLILECEVTVERPDGELVLELSKGADRFRARFDLASGKCTLYRLDKAHTGSGTPGEDDYKEIDSRPTDLKGKGTRRVRFANVDDRLVVWVGNSLPFGDGVSYPPVAERGPYPNDLQPASIGVKGAAVRVGSLRLFRDTYYTVKLPPEEPPDASLPFSLPRWGDSEREQVEKLTDLHRLLSDPDRWKPLRELPARTYYVQPNHYLCLGDNSPESSDGRSWGLVPRRLLLGRALLVYWPAGRVGAIK